ncbi:uncharacterized protein BXZ73DRAFT_111787 [Epithele typhae]|uniref:uncharacterized protein n=1 Tax=Epithele typhae TaxID=378194 RepID=UPI002007FE8C|nr:uncharacterized protein BXZ73DRAFT_111787 [Epithele typhae]KAH9897077.1 hypothetical protein BXZ73DRAFT_111787 [Epithele typhae]
MSSSTLPVPERIIRAATQRLSRITPLPMPQDEPIELNDDGVVAFLAQVPPQEASTPVASWSREECARVGMTLVAAVNQCTGPAFRSGMEFFLDELEADATTAEATFDRVDTLVAAARRAIRLQRDNAEMEDLEGWAWALFFQLQPKDEDFSPLRAHVGRLLEAQGVDTLADDLVLSQPRAPPSPSPAPSASIFRLNLSLLPSLPSDSGSGLRIKSATPVATEKNSAGRNFPTLFELRRQCDYCWGAKSDGACEGGCQPCARCVKVNVKCALYLLRADGWVSVPKLGPVTFFDGSTFFIPPKFRGSQRAVIEGLVDFLLGHLTAQDFKIVGQVAVPEGPEALRFDYHRDDARAIAWRYLQSMASRMHVDEGEFLDTSDLRRLDVRAEPAPTIVYRPFRPAPTRSLPNRRPAPKKVKATPPVAEDVEMLNEPDKPIKPIPRHRSTRAIAVKRLPPRTVGPDAKRKRTGLVPEVVVPSRQPSGDSQKSAGTFSMQALHTELVPPSSISVSDSDVALDDDLFKASFVYAAATYRLANTLWLEAVGRLQDIAVQPQEERDKLRRLTALLPAGLTSVDELLDLSLKADLRGPPFASSSTAGPSTAGPSVAGGNRPVRVVLSSPESSDAEAVSAHFSGVEEEDEEEEAASKGKGKATRVGARRIARRP